MISAQVAGISQEFNFETRAQETFAVFTLRNGHSFRAPITDDTAQVLIRLSLEEGPPSPSSETESLPAAPAMTHTNGTNGTSHVFVDGRAPDGTDAHVFGGDVGSSSEESAPAVMTVKPRVVGKDAMGYPILDAPGSVNPSVVTGTFGEGDEDGVRQL